ncbi:MAG: dehydratase [Bacteroidetes bacterium]|nr:MAG: dehydratase [Bacteroidota bacterium]
MISENLLFLENLSIGQEFVSREYPLDAEQIISFASQYDPQPFHMDPEAAQNSFFKGLVASGWHTASVSMRLMVETMHFSGGVIGLGGEISWPRPTRAQDVLHVHCKITDIIPSKSKTDRGIVHLQSQTINQDGEVVQQLTAKLVVFRRAL